jgi:hypothetical protein
MVKFAALALVFFAALVQIAFAGQHEGTDQDQKACIHGVTRFCRKVMDQGDLTVLSCLQQNRARLGSACRKVLSDHGV